MATDNNSSYETYYVPESSKFPIWASVGLAIMMIGLGNMLNDLSADIDSTTSMWTCLFGFFILACVLYSWFATTIRENHQGLPSAQLKRSYVLGMYWFIFSEVMFFCAFFGALFYVRTLSVPWLSGEGGRGASAILWPAFEDVWPVISNPNAEIFTNPHESMAWKSWADAGHYLPLWNTILLLTSSVTCHMAHVGLKNNDRKKLIGWLSLTVLLGVVFLFLQVEEYLEAYSELGLTLDSGIYGSTFFLLTGFHGFHVTLGAFMLFVMLLRSIKGHFKPEDHFGFEAASWYWHFVDVVWVCLFFFVYIY